MSHPTHRISIAAADGTRVSVTPIFNSPGLAGDEVGHGIAVRHGEGVGQSYVSNNVCVGP